MPCTGQCLHLPTGAPGGAVSTSVGFCLWFLGPHSPLSNDLETARLSEQKELCLLGFLPKREPSFSMGRDSGWHVVEPSKA